MKKQLLSESEIRKMMKFANIGSLASPFVERLNENYESGADLEEGMHEDEDDDEEAPETPQRPIKIDAPKAPRKRVRARRNQ